MEVFEKKKVYSASLRDKFLNLSFNISIKLLISLKRLGISLICSLASKAALTTAPSPFNVGVGIHFIASFEVRRQTCNS